MWGQRSHRENIRSFVNRCRIKKVSFTLGLIIGVDVDDGEGVTMYSETWTSRDGTFCSLNKSLVLQYDHVFLMAYSLPFNSFLLPEAESLYLLQQSRMKEKRTSRSEELEPTQPCRCILSIAQGYAIKMWINTKEKVSQVDIYKIIWCFRNTVTEKKLNR